MKKLGCEFILLICYLISNTEAVSANSEQQMYVDTAVDDKRMANTTYVCILRDMIKCVFVEQIRMLTYNINIYSTKFQENSQMRSDLQAVSNKLSQLLTYTNNISNIVYGNNKPGNYEESNYYNLDNRNSLVNTSIVDLTNIIEHLKCVDRSQNYTVLNSLINYFQKESDFTMVEYLTRFKEAVIYCINFLSNMVYSNKRDMLIAVEGNVKTPALSDTDRPSNRLLERYHNGEPLDLIFNDDEEGDRSLVKEIVDQLRNYKEVKNISITERFRDISNADTDEFTP